MLASLGLGDRYESFCCTLLRGDFVLGDLIIEPNERDGWLKASTSAARHTGRSNDGSS